MKKKIIFPINSKIYSGLESVAITIIENLKDKFDFIYVTQDGPIVDILKEKKINYYIIKNIYSYDEELLKNKIDKLEFFNEDEIIYPENDVYKRN